MSLDKLLFGSALLAGPLMFIIAVLLRIIRKLRAGDNLSASDMDAINKATGIVDRYRDDPRIGTAIEEAEKYCDAQ